MQQHTFSHVPFKDIVYSPAPGLVGTIPASPAPALAEELAFTSRLIRDHLGGECVGLRTPFGYYRGLRDRPDLLEIVRGAGLRYVTSWGRNQENANPTPWVQPFDYAEEGYPDILELPFQFWLDVVWFDRHGYDTGPAFLEALKGALRAYILKVSSLAEEGDAKSQKLLRLVPTLNVPAVATKHPAGTAHSVAANAGNNHVFVPLAANNAFPDCLKGCIAVYGRPSSEDDDE